MSLHLLPARYDLYSNGNFINSLVENYIVNLDSFISDVCKFEPYECECMCYCFGNRWIWYKKNWRELLLLPYIYSTNKLSRLLFLSWNPWCNECMNVSITKWPFCSSSRWSLGNWNTCGGDNWVVYSVKICNV